MFHETTNKGPISDAAVVDVFDEIHFEVGQCYTNTEKILQAFNQAGLVKDVQAMTGWLFVGPKPIHHCWAVYQEQYVIDAGVDMAQLSFQDKVHDMMQNGQRPDKEDLRMLLVNEQEAYLDEPNHKTKAFGEVYPDLLYIGSYNSPDEGREIFNKLIQEYPNHPSYAEQGMNTQGASRIQQMFKN